MKTNVDINFGGTAKVVNLAAGVNPGDAVNKSQLDTAVTGLLEFIGSTNCSTNPNYPAGNKGDMYIVSVAGKIGGGAGINVDVGDSIIAIADNIGGTHAAVGTSWTILETNREQATETSVGIAELATQAEVTTGTNDTNIITPLKLRTEIDAHKYAQNIGDAVATAIVVNHTLNTRDVIVQVRDNTSYLYEVVDVEATSTTSVTITFLVAPALNAKRVIILS